VSSLKPNLLQPLKLIYDGNWNLIFAAVPFLLLLVFYIIYQRQRPNQVILLLKYIIRLKSEAKDITLDRFDMDTNPIAVKVLSTFDDIKHLQSEQDIADHLRRVFADGDAVQLAVALGDVAWVRGMTQLARDAGLSRVSLYKSLYRFRDLKLHAL